MMLFGGVYQKKYLNILEWSSLISLILLSAIYSCLFEKLGTQRMVTIISVSFALAKFIAVLVYHVFLCVKYFECFKNLAIKKFNHSNNEESERLTSMCTSNLCNQLLLMCG